MQQHNTETENTQHRALAGLAAPAHGRARGGTGAEEHSCGPRGWRRTTFASRDRKLAATFLFRLQSRAKLSKVSLCKWSEVLWTKLTRQRRSAAKIRNLQKGRSRVVERGGLSFLQISYRGLCILPSRPLAAPPRGSQR